MEKVSLVHQKSMGVKKGEFGAPEVNGCGKGEFGAPEANGCGKRGVWST